ncbi:MAG TPA: dihydropteroate synthase [Candidatus Elarobacter sp.]|nr:dihydropteroate synthase [Dongiaceae bacterium]HZW52568.1 dihydropteroate synthase [Candidatus Elarobacter sp.]
MHVRFLARGAAAELRARYGGALAAEDAARLAGAAEALVLVVRDPVAASALELVRGCGAEVARAGGATGEITETLIATTRGALDRARASAHGEDAAFVAALIAAFERAAEPAASLRVRDRVLDLRGEARVMGIVNVTPDSFHERAAGVDEAVAQARAMVADGAAIVDVGGQSYSAASGRISADEERARVVPAVRALLAARLGAVLSIDTYTAAVADAALAAGAHLVNDCSGLSDPALPDVVAKHGAALVVMHLKGRLNVREPQTYVYRDALAEIVDFLYERTERAVRGGVARDAIVVDPGLEFGKEPPTDLEILERFGELRALGYPILFASSRKTFIGRVLGLPSSELLAPSLATATIGIAAGARIVRVHDVRETVRLVRMLAAVRDPRTPAAEPRG